MSKTIRGPSSPQPRTPDAAGPRTTGGALMPGTGKIAEKKDKQKALKKPSTRPAARTHRQHRAHGAGHAGGAHGAEGPDEEGGGGAGGVEAGSGSDELHRRHSHDVEHVEHEDEIEHHEEAHDTAATGADAIKRSKGDTGGGDGFEGNERGQREAYERYMRGNVHKDQERFDELRKKGAKDDFKPERAAMEVESLGTHRATAHVVRLYEHWTLEGVERGEAVARAASFLAGFQNVQNIRKVLAELESKPIRDVYPLEVLMKILEERPELVPGVRPGSVIGNLEDLHEGKKVIAGYPSTLQVPVDVRLKSFALLGGGRPGYELAPAVEEGKYTLLVDTPGEWRFAILAAPLQQLGRIQRETGEAILQVFQVTVYAMGKKGEPIPPDEWRALLELDGDDGSEADGLDDDHDGDEDDGEVDGGEAPRAEVILAPPLPVQIRAQLEAIRRDDSAAGTSTTATTYSWDASFFKPGGPMTGEPILHLVVEKAGPFDVAWVKAREALAQKQREYEPGRATVTQEDFTAALRRARVR